MLWPDLMTSMRILQPTRMVQGISSVYGGSYYLGNPNFRSELDKKELFKSTRYHIKPDVFVVPATKFIPYLLLGQLCHQISSLVR
jgi:hypothetical protein